MLNNIPVSSNMLLIHVKADGATSYLKYLYSEYLSILKSEDSAKFYETWDENHGIFQFITIRCINYSIID